jgi:predicted transcriptional regulator
MAKNLVEMAADIVAAQANSGRMSPDELSGAIHRVYDALVEIERKQRKGEEEPEATDSGLAYLRAHPDKAITRSYIVSLESGEKFKQITARHLSKYKLTPAEYRAKWGYSKRQPLVAKALSAKRRKTALDNKLGERLAAARRRRLAQKS